jgi:hypothetical protein
MCFGFSSNGKWLKLILHLNAKGAKNSITSTYLTVSGQTLNCSKPMSKANKRKII